MEDRVSNDELSRFSDFVARTVGLHFPPPRWLDLQRGLKGVAQEMGFHDTAACARSLMSTALTKAQVEMLAGNLTVGETYFFREPNSFEALRREILPPLIQARRAGERRLRIWSAACCTGEEAYSIAILLHQLIPDLHQWNITLLATDLNPRFLRKAAAGVFGPWSFRDAPAGFKERYFRATPDGRFELLPSIRRLVRFANLNLVEDTYPSLVNDTNAMDVIFCRNVLIYFTEGLAKEVIGKLYSAQLDGGWLVVSATELPQASASAYRSVNFGDSILYQKCQGEPGSRHRSARPTLFPARSPHSGIDAMPVLQNDFPTAAPHSEQPSRPVVPSLIDTPVLPVQQPREAGDIEPGLPASQGSRGATDFHPQVRVLANAGRLTEALDCCNQWIDADKLNSLAHYLRAAILQERGAVDEAVLSLRAALYLNPGFVLGHFAMANIARYRGRGPDARKHLDNALRLLRSCAPQDVLPESDGITAGRLTEIITSLMDVEVFP